MLCGSYSYELGTYLHDSSMVTISGAKDYIAAEPHLEITTY
jgi:hypothetical protein